MSAISGPGQSRSVRKNQMEATSTLQIGFLLFPSMTQLDLTGPFEVLVRLPDASIHIAAKTLEPVRTEHGLCLLPTTTLEGCPPLDVLVVPGGPGQQGLMEDAATLQFLRRQAESAQYITSVCTGALLLGAAGLLRGHRATTHWQCLPLLEWLGAIAVEERVVTDGKVITAAGVSAGIDFALQLAARLRGEEVAQVIQLQIEYDPAPPFASGSTRTARAEVVALLRERGAGLLERRSAVCREIGGRDQED
ncbi:MAG TPA: DJ-1/PfpI family protein [Terriglobales bacterium]|nr:DJ-1/PfpI family protein [Terriglobales bacterium]